MSPREALADAARLADTAERRCRAIMGFHGFAGTRCAEMASEHSVFCWTHTHAASSPKRSRPLEFLPSEFRLRPERHCPNHGGTAAAARDCDECASGYP